MSRTFETLTFDNTYARLGEAFSRRVDPTPVPSPRLIAFNPAAAELLDLDTAVAHRPESAEFLSGNRPLPGAEPVAMLYAGHQFGVWVPQLGDGRAILLGEVRNSRGGKWDLHLKGAGITPFSRDGDGRAVLRSTVREYLGSEAMHGLGVPTTRALCIVATPMPVYRETVETGALLTRLAPSHVRFGSFEVFASRRREDLVLRLADHVIDAHYPHLSHSGGRGIPARDGDAPPAAAADRCAAFLAEVVVRTARLVADWQAVGFAHGVLNTDNMSVLGLTLDYGPFGFLDDFDPGFICNHSDHTGRYAFGRQPRIGLWNLARFAEALLGPITEQQAVAALDAYPDAFNERFAERMRARLGLTTAEPEDLDMINRLLDLLADGRVDYTNFLRDLGNFRTDGPADARSRLRDWFPDPTGFDAWAVRYRARLAHEGPVGGEADAARKQRMDRANPKYVLRNYLAQNAIAAAERGDFTEIERLRELLADPFAERPDREAYAAPPPDWGRRLEISCSS